MGCLLRLATGVEIEQAAVSHQLHMRTDAAIPGAPDLVEVSRFLLAGVARHAVPAGTKDQTGLARNFLLGTIIEERSKSPGANAVAVGTGVVAVEREDRFAPGPRRGSLAGGSSQRTEPGCRRGNGRDRAADEPATVQRNRPELHVGLSFWDDQTQRGLLLRDSASQGLGAGRFNTIDHLFRLQASVVRMATAVS